MRDVAAQLEAGASVARETLEPMLDELARGLGYDRALVLAYDADSGSLHGLFGLNVRDEQARSLSVPLSRADHPLVVALRGGIPQLVDDVSADERLDHAELLRRASESHAIEKEWLWWMLNAVDDPVLVADAQNDILHSNRRAELLFRASDEDSAGKRRAVWMNNFLFTASLSTWSLERASRADNREVTLVDPIDGSELIFEVITKAALNHRTGERGTVSVLKDVTDLRHMTVELTRSAQRIQTADEEIRGERDRLDLVLRSVPNPIIVVDNDNQIISMNVAARRLFAPDAGRGQHALAND